MTYPVGYLQRDCPLSRLIYALIQLPSDAATRPGFLVQ